MNNTTTNNNLLLLFLVWAQIFILVSSICLTSVVIPDYAILGKGTLLQCDFELGGDSLYALKWYKDNHEFFRYKPGDAPPMTVFPMNGVNVNVSASSLHSLTLDSAVMSSGGVYRCEISAEAPSFQTLGEDHLLHIIALPERGPTISGLHPWSNIGEVLNLKCHVHKAFPSPTLSWWINHTPIKQSGCRGCTSSGESYEAGKSEDGTTLYSSTSHLSLRVDTGLLRDGRLALECRASFPHAKDVVLRHALLSNVKAGSGFGGLAHYADTLANGGGCSIKVLSPLHLLGVVAIMTSVL